MTDWSEYFKYVGSRPNILVVNLLAKFPSDRRGLVLDLGAGNLRDSKFILSQGFDEVIAVDSYQKSRSFIVPKIDLRTIAIQEFQGNPDSFDIAISCNTLFFLFLQEIDLIFQEVHRCLKPDGVFTCNILASDDSWIKYGKRGVYSFSKKQVVDFCRNFTGYEIKELRQRATTSSGVLKFSNQWVVTAYK